MSTVTYERPSGRGADGSLPGFLTRIAGGVRRYVTLSRAESQLERLDDRLLLDIGLRRSDIQRMVWGGVRR